VEPMYMLGRRRTASRPPSTWISAAEYSGLIGVISDACLSWFIGH
jgi:hypothetical protein